MNDSENFPDIRNFARAVSDPACLVSVSVKLVGSSMYGVVIKVRMSRRWFVNNSARRSSERGCIRNIAENNEQHSTNSKGGHPSLFPIRFEAAVSSSCLKRCLFRIRFQRRKRLLFLT